MVNPDLQSAIEALTVEERLELVDYIESTVFDRPAAVTEEHKSLIRSRASDLEADPSLAISWDEMKARLADRRG